MKNKIESVVRVAVLNNFNCTKKEYTQLDTFAALYPSRYFFINSNVNTPRLRNINEHPYKAVITVNPNIRIDPNNEEWRNVLTVDKKKVAFLRVKYVPDTPEIPKLIKYLSRRNYNVVITLQRFNGKKSVADYGIENYKFSFNRYRLTDKRLNEVLNFADNTHNVYVCDRNGVGCGGCGLCSLLTVKMNVPIYSLNLSTSGLCKFNCLDCYAKTMQRFTTGCGYKAINYDLVRRNCKQKGNTAHIKAMKIKNKIEGR